MSHSDEMKCTLQLAAERTSDFIHAAAATPHGDILRGRRRYFEASEPPHVPYVPHRRRNSINKAGPLSSIPHQFPLSQLTCTHPHTPLRPPPDRTFALHTMSSHKVAAFATLALALCASAHPAQPSDYGKQSHIVVTSVVLIIHPHLSVRPCRAFRRPGV